MIVSIQFMAAVLTVSLKQLDQTESYVLQTKQAVNQLKLTHVKQVNLDVVTMVSLRPKVIRKKTVRIMWLI